MLRFMHDTSDSLKRFADDQIAQRPAGAASLNPIESFLHKVVFR